MSRRPGPSAPGSSSPPMTARSPDGTASGPAISAATTPDAIYLGLAIGSSAGANYLYAANFPARGSTSSTPPSRRPAFVRGDFVDPGLPAGYAPFGIQAIGDEIFVAYAKQDAAATRSSTAKASGIVSAFGMDGSFHGRVASAGELNAPWGLAMAPVGLRQVQRRPARRQLRRRPDPCLPADRERLGGARPDQGHRPPADLDRRPVGHRLRPWRHDRLRPVEHPVLRGRPERRDGGPVRIDHPSRSVTG